MLRALYPTSYGDARHLSRRLPAVSRVRVIGAARWLVTALVLWLVLRSIDIGTVLDLIRRAALPGLGLAALIVAAQFVALVWRWQLVTRILGGRTVSLGPLSVFLGHSFLFGQVLPSSVGGDVARTVMLARLTGPAAATRSVICDRLIGFATLALLVVLTLPIISGWMDGATPSLSLIAAAPGTIAAATLVLASPSVIRAIPWLRCPVAMLAGDIRLILRSGKLTLAVVLVSVGSTLFAVLLIYTLGSAIGAHLRALDCLVLVPPALLASALPISFGGWGVREGALLAAFSLVEADPAGVAATSVMFGLTTPLAGAAVATASFFAGWRNTLPKGSRDGV
jgi:uncharacterized membrane protein YbhN (UPF0104 family)